VLIIDCSGLPLERLLLPDKRARRTPEVSLTPQKFRAGILRFCGPLCRVIGWARDQSSECRLWRLPGAGGTPQNHSIMGKDLTPSGDSSFFSFWAVAYSRLREIARFLGMLHTVRWPRRDQLTSQRRTGPPDYLAQNQAVHFPDEAEQLSPWKQMVGASGFEPPTSWSRTRFQALLKPMDSR